MSIRKGFIGRKFSQLIRGKYLDLHVTVFLALFVLVMRGTSGEGQASFLSQFLKGYIEETSVSVASLVRSSNENSYYISNVVSADFQKSGQGGNATPATETPDLAFVQGSSIMSSVGSQDSPTQRSQTVEYTVQSGDAISFIASDYGVSIQSILWANNLRNADSIAEGQILRIPPVSGVIHTIKKGDTIASLSKKYQADQDRILEFNDLGEGTPLRIGIEIIIPDGKILPNQSASQAKSAQDTRQFTYLPNLGDYFLPPTTGYNWNVIHGRNGVDVANSCGTPIYAAADGKVANAVETGWNGGYGRYIKIVHPNATETLYAHLSKKSVVAGDDVTKGELIGLMGTTGRSTGCHLHFEVHGAKNLFSKK